MTSWWAAPPTDKHPMFLTQQAAEPEGRQAQVRPSEEASGAVSLQTHFVLRHRPSPAFAADGGRPRRALQERPAEGTAIPGWAGGAWHGSAVHHVGRPEAAPPGTGRIRIAFRTRRRREESRQPVYKTSARRPSQTSRRGKSRTGFRMFQTEMKATRQWAPARGPDQASGDMWTSRV